MVIEARCRRAATIFLLAPAGERRQDRLPQTGQLSQSAGDLVPIHARHTYVEENHGWAVVRYQVEGFGAAEGDSNLVALEPQKSRETRGGVLIVVHDQEPVAR